MIKFWKQFSHNLIAVVIPAIVSIAAISVLVRITDSQTSGTILWSWFLMTMASGLNIGLHPSLTNDLGSLSRSDPKWSSIVSTYVSASNTIILIICCCVLIWASATLGLSTLIFVQLAIIWLTGLVSLLMTALNFNGDASRTALSKLVFNTFCILGPLALIWLNCGIFLALFVIVMAKAIQFWRMARSVMSRMDQDLNPVLVRPIDILSTSNIIYRQWRLVTISAVQLSFGFVDRYIVIAVYGMAAYKSYGALLDLLGVIWIASSIFILLLHPKLASFDLSLKEKLVLTDRFSILLIVLGSGVLAALYYGSDLILYWVLNIDDPKYYKEIIRNLAMGLVFNISYVIYNTFFIATMRQGLLIFVSLPILCLYCIVAPFVVGHYGILGLSYLFAFRFFVEAFIFHCIVYRLRRKGVWA